MRTLTERQARDLDRLLLDAAHELREHAAQHLYRADACRAVGERVLHTYHRQHAESVQQLVNQLVATRAVLAQRTSPAPARAVRTSRRPAA
jgi:hypothetical protein